jgi:hypothetical protein
MNEQQRKQAGYLESAKARRLKFVNRVFEIIESQRKELNDSEQQGGDYSIDDICDKIKGAIEDEMVTGWARGH